MPLSDEQLAQTFRNAKNAAYRTLTARTHEDAHVAGLRAVEAAVRTDQIEKDAAIVERTPGEQYEQFGGNGIIVGEPPTQHAIAAAIRAQLTEGNGDE